MPDIKKSGMLSALASELQARQTATAITQKRSGIL
jgi:hypothetical protein